MKALLRQGSTACCLAPLLAFQGRQKAQLLESKSLVMQEPRRIVVARVIMPSLRTAALCCSAALLFPFGCRWAPPLTRSFTPPLCLCPGVRAGVPVDVRSVPVARMNLPPASVDAVVSVYGLSATKDTAAVLREAVRVLKPGKVKQRSSPLSFNGSPGHELFATGRPLLQ